jgi:hypothetical protein
MLNHAIGGDDTFSYVADNPSAFATNTYYGDAGGIMSDHAIGVNGTFTTNHHVTLSSSDTICPAMLSAATTRSAATASSINNDGVVHSQVALTAHDFILA